MNTSNQKAFLSKKRADENFEEYKQRLTKLLDEKGFFAPSPQPPTIVPKTPRTPFSKFWEDIIEDLISSGYAETREEAVRLINDFPFC